MCVGPATPDGRGEVRNVLVRRYVCCRCSAVMQVVPRGLLRGRWYAAAAISLALGLWTLMGQPSLRVRERISPWPVVGDSARHRGWITLARWTEAGAEGRLFGGVTVSVADQDHRTTAGRIATSLLGFVPAADRQGDRETQLYLAGEHAM